MRKIKKRIKIPQAKVNQKKKFVLVITIIAIFLFFIALLYLIYMLILDESNVI